MKFFVIFLVFVCEVFAVSLTEIRDDFNSANYAKVCNQKVELMGRVWREMMPKRTAITFDE